MKLSDAILGTPVLVKVKTQKDYSNVGHIVGFGLNSVGEILIRVHCATGVELKLHQTNVEILQAESGYIHPEKNFCDTSLGLIHE